MKQLQNIYDFYEQMHRDPKMFQGFSLQTYIPEISLLIKDTNIRSLLDYGCGKAQAHTMYKLPALWGIEQLCLYDPGVPEYQTKPTGKYDMTICIDVMEHVPEEHVDLVLQEIASYTTKVAVFSISTRPAKKLLPDGRNAHLTVKPMSWWKNKLNQMPIYTKAFFPC